MSDRSQPRKILHVFGRMDRGGAEMRTLDVMRGIDRDQYRFEFCALSGRSGDLDEEITALGGTTHLCKLNLLFPWRFIQLLRNNSFDVVHSHVWLMSGLILLLARIAGIPVRIAHFRSTGAGKKGSVLRPLRDEVLRWLIDRHATAIIAVSKGVLSEAWGQYRALDHRCRVIYNGVDSRYFRTTRPRNSVRHEIGIPHDAIVYAHVGRFTPAKNHERLIDIFSRIHQAQPAAVLVLIGDGDASRVSKIRGLIETLGLDESVRILGNRTDVPDLLVSADVLIFPSTREGLPGAVLEARAAGLPVLCSDLPGTREIAERLDHVQILSLADDDQYWASAAISLAEMTKGARIAAPFASSEFELANSIPSFEETWR